METKRNITLFTDERRQQEIDSSNKYVDHQKNIGDFYITVSLFKDIKLINPYVEVFQDESKFTIPRQEINPYFLELGFFRGVENVNSTTSIKRRANTYNIEINS